MLENFLYYLKKEKRYSDHTVLAYNNDLKEFFEMVEINSGAKEELLELNPQQIRAFVVQLSKSGLNPKTINRKLSAGRSFYKYLMIKEGLDENPFARVRGPKNLKKLPEFVSKKDIDFEKTKLIFDNDFSGVRDKLIFELLYQTGVRLNELIHIRPIDFTGTQLKVLGKRNKERLIPLSTELVSLIRFYEDLARPLNTSEYLLCTDAGKKMYPKFVYRKINFYLSKLTTIKKKSPHVMRHTFATHILNEGAGLEIIKEILGHANLSATQVYTHNSFEKINSIYKSAHPRERKP